MAPTIETYLDSLERVLLGSPAISAYLVLQREATLTKGKLRARARLQDGGLLELFEYVIQDANTQIVRAKYSYHWQNRDGHLLRRWDNVPHYQHLSSAPHHVHTSDESVEPVLQPPDLGHVLADVETHLLSGGLT